MKTLFDTSVLVAASVRHHEHFPRAFEALHRVTAKRTRGLVCCHALAETYAVLTRLPVSPRIHPSEARRIIEENVLAHFEVAALSPRRYIDAIHTAADLGVMGGAFFDLLHLQAARANDCGAILTFNTAQFRRLAPDLASKIAAP